MFTKRSIAWVIFLTIITIGIYLIYWFVVTKRELNKAGAQVPTTFLLIIPIANFYYLYKFSEAFNTYVLDKKENELLYFLLFALLLPVGVVIAQDKINNKI